MSRNEYRLFDNHPTNRVEREAKHFEAYSATTGEVIDRGTQAQLISLVIKNRDVYLREAPEPKEIKEKNKFELILD